MRLVRVYANILFYILSYAIMDGLLIYWTFQSVVSYYPYLNYVGLPIVAVWMFLATWILVCNAAILDIWRSWWKMPYHGRTRAASDYWLSKVKVPDDFSKDYRTRKKSNLYRSVFLLFGRADEDEIAKLYFRIEQSRLYGRFILDMISEVLDKDKVFDSDFDNLYYHLGIPRSENSPSWWKDHRDDILIVLTAVSVVLSAILVSR